MKGKETTREYAEDELTDQEKYDISESQALIATLEEIIAWTKTALLPIYQELKLRVAHLENKANAKNYIRRVLALRNKLAVAIESNNQSDKLREFADWKPSVNSRIRNNIRFNEQLLKLRTLILTPNRFHPPDILVFLKELESLKKTASEFITITKTPKRGDGRHERIQLLLTNLEKATKPSQPDEINSGD